MKIFIEESYEEDFEGVKEIKWKKKSEELNLEEAKLKAIKPKERIHVCYHDEKNPRGCEIK